VSHARATAAHPRAARRDHDVSDGGYYSTRYTPDARRAPVWRHITRYLSRWIPPDADVLELGAGYCDFSNHVQARSRTAMDVDGSVRTHAAPDVHTVVGDCRNLSMFDDESVDVVFASNLLEHLDRSAVDALLDDVRRILRPRGRLILVQPNYRLRPRQYFDDYTHVTVFSDRSLVDLLEARGLPVVHVQARFLPLTMKSRLAGAHRLVPLYLRSPIKPLAGQMLVVAERPLPKSAPNSA
jgi:SAM-dependent methyltransferase